MTNLKWVTIEQHELTWLPHSPACFIMVFVALLVKKCILHTPRQLNINLIDINMFIYIYIYVCFLPMDRKQISHCTNLEHKRSAILASCCWTTCNWLKSVRWWFGPNGKEHHTTLYSSVAAVAPGSRKCRLKGIKARFLCFLSKFLISNMKLAVHSFAGSSSVSQRSKSNTKQTVAMGQEKFSFL